MLGAPTRRSVKTTAAGVATILAGVAAIIKACVDGQYEIAIAAAPAVISGLQGLFARDHDVTSRQAGAE